MRQTDYVEDSVSLSPDMLADQSIADHLHDQSGLSPLLYNADLAPTSKMGRQWSAYSIFALWANDVHNLGNYTFAIGLFSLGLGGWQVLLAFGFGAVFLFLLLNLSGYMGEKTGIPFPVMSRIAFGTRGAQIPALLRGAVAIAWFGIQTYLASLVLQLALLAFYPALKSFQTDNLLGLSSLGWATFLLLWVIQLLIVSYGMEMIRKYEAVAGPVILMTFVALAGWILLRAKFSIAWEMPHALSGTAMWMKILGAAALWVAVYGTFILNFCDFTREAKSRNSIFWGNFWGIPVNMLLFGGVVVVLAGGQYHIDGQIIASPADIVAMIPDTFLLVMATLSLLILTIGVNLMANFVAPTYALTNLMPQYMNFRKAAFLSALIGLLILPWNLYNSPLVIPIFLGGLGALLGPLFGIIMVDYWIIRKQNINIPALYSNEIQSEYHYMAGSNPRAIIALIVSGGIALGLTFLPFFAVLRDFSWFMAAGLAGIIYFLIADRRGPFTDVDGEKISVSPCH
ncbi:NCS1 family nucleobase:cation symporter-1 [Aquitalea denitrificans]|uniref:NCS1 family nucleobase:cation symporter-1 n=1 Tax=Aquitalea denitrificans TaxID=519081 RepID=UPI0013591FBA|nr:NCS1 family nucleobase:cation symporter-1 [Aquitalea denitrificans]